MIMAITMQQYIANLEKKLNDLDTFSKPLRIAAFDVTAKMGERIFDEGKKADGTTIINHKAGIGGSQLYSEKPIYVSGKAVPKPRGVLAGKPQGKRKTGRTKREVKRKGELFAVETKHSSKYFATGYKGYRENVGRQTGYIDLVLTGELRLDFSNGKKETPEPRKINELEYHIRLDKQINLDKREGLEEKYGEIFAVSNEERELFNQTVGREFRRILKQ